jgi:CrcB protein
VPEWIWIAAGGAVGSLSRYYMGTWIADRMGFWVPGGVLQAPVGTFAINVVGSFLIGIIATLAATRSAIVTHEMRLLLAVGFCGGYTTFSTFSLEAWTLIQRGHMGEAAVYVLASTLVGLMAVIGGCYAARLFA